MSLPLNHSRTSTKWRSLRSAVAAICALPSVACAPSADSDHTGKSHLGSVTNAVVSAPVFPLQLSANQRYLVDQNNTPFLINQASSWGLIQALPTTDAGDYMDALKAKGFNTLLVSIISYDVRMAGNPPNWQRVPPFTTQSDYATHNSPSFG